ncbi:MAG: hypothetical protein ACJ74U_15170 [Jatrophihabitantaceae bacterium]
MNRQLCHDAHHPGEVSCTYRVIDIGYALDLLDSCVRDRGEYYQPPPDAWRSHPPAEPEHRWAPAGDSMVVLAVRKAGAPQTALSALANTPIAEVYASGCPALNLTLGAVVVLHAAESAERRGQTWAMAQQAALRAASRFLELIPDRLASHAAAAGAPYPRGLHELARWR